jgi:hypothetical protein
MVCRTTVFYVGDRKDLKPIPILFIFPPAPVTLKVISMLAHVGYKYNSQLTGCKEQIIAKIKDIKNG